ncbi:hypothetical protein ANO14919_145330 [Xylariales sp. No.14919]|nr:hypothetical protein ANO14919_145330 [Xylariales sp. No.14919]
MTGHRVDQAYSEYGISPWRCLQHRHSRADHVIAASWPSANRWGVGHYGLVDDEKSGDQVITLRGDPERVHYQSYTENKLLHVVFYTGGLTGAYAKYISRENKKPPGLGASSLQPQGCFLPTAAKTNFAKPRDDATFLFSYCFYLFDPLALRKKRHFRREL